MNINLTTQFVYAIETQVPSLLPYLENPVEKNGFILRIPSGREGFSLNIWCGDCIAIGFDSPWHIHPSSENPIEQIQETIELIDDIINNRQKLVFNSKYQTEIYFEEEADIDYAPQEDEKIIIGYWKDASTIPWEIR